MRGTVIQALLERFRRELQARFGDRLLRVMLFGSWARGEANADSDVDVFVEVGGLTGRERGEVFELAAEVSMGTGIRLAALAMSEREFAEHLRLERLIAEEILREGVSVD